ncbi:hypothetical protein DAQ1742_01902 [Dickeya aquatica]|uniref:Uncharacterized protein n=1 Tax=Dickeya aquatica TaxID=1401087 RepID=A0A375A9N9_9GAMM|nr:hypothetical protein DAQ1742_01902 [Dickeya aquatica]
MFCTAIIPASATPRYYCRLSPRPDNQRRYGATPARGSLLAWKMTSAPTQNACTGRRTQFPRSQNA